MEIWQISVAVVVVIVFLSWLYKIVSARPRSGLLHMGTVRSVDYSHGGLQRQPITPLGLLHMGSVRSVEYSHRGLQRQPITLLTVSSATGYEDIRSVWILGRREDIHLNDEVIFQMAYKNSKDLYEEKKPTIIVIGDQSYCQLNWIGPS